MAQLDFIEKGYFEKLFGMESGYVLNFSNPKFQEFVYEKIQIDIYKKYTRLSKAKILRAIIADSDNITIGKLLLELLRYMQANNMVGESDRDTFKKCAEIGNRLIGKTVSPITKSNTTQPKPVGSIIDYNKYLRELTALTNCDDTPQSRGFAFEKYLRNYFEISGLEPRGSFRIVGEQIDGSFILHNEVYLLEAKWTNKPLDKSNLVIFNEKVSSKSSFTRGLYISYSGYSDEALSTFAIGRKVSIVLMTVQELAIALSKKTEIKDLIWSKVRALAEEGNFNKLMI